MVRVIPPGFTHTTHSSTHMKKILLLPFLAVLTTPVLLAEGTETLRETITLKSDKVSEETFTETASGNGMFYSDKNKVGFLAAGTAENPYYISSADDTHANKDDISLSYGSGHTVTVGGFTGDAHLAIGSQDNQIRVYTENSLFVGGYGWHGTSGWRNNATLTSNTRGEIPFEAHEGSITINKGSSLETGTGTTALGGAQIYIGHGGKGTITVDGGILTSRAFIGIATPTGTPDDNSGLLEIKNGGKVYLTAEPDQINSYYNQLMVGASNTGKGTILISGEGSEMIMESSADTPQASTGQTTHWSFISIGTGNNGNGEVTVTDSATLTLGTQNAGSTQIALGEGTGATGTLSITENAKANLNGTTIVGYQGSASMDIQSGGEVTQTSGNLFVGYAGGEGDLTVGKDASLTAEGVSIGGAGAKGFVAVEQGGTMTVSGNLTATDTLDDAFSNSLENAGTVNIGGYLYLTDGTSTTNSGTISATGAVYIANGSSLTNNEGATLESTGSFISMDAGSQTTNNGTMIAKDIYIAAGAELTNTGTLETSGGNDGIVLSDGASINNEGTLSGKLSGNGSVEGSGIIGNVTIGEDTTLVVGSSDAPIVGLEATSITLAAGSSTLFNVDGAANVTMGGESTWGEGMHSIIFGETAIIESGALIELLFNGDMFTFGETTELDLLLIAGGASSEYGNLDELMNNTTFSLNSSVLTLRSANALSIDTSGLSYEVKDNSLYLVGTAELSIPEPTTATLSLLALAALASRRRRK